MPELKASKRLVISATIAGNVLEWYEFGLYAYLGPTIASLFFPPTDQGFAATVNVLMIFSIGFLSRPFGGLLFGSLGDRLGRRFALLLSIVTMSLPTFVIGFLPTFAQVGYLAPLSLCIFRLIQGIPVGGEFPGTICYLMETAGSKEKGFFSSFAFFGSQLGILFNVAECLLLETFLTKEQILDWGWRISFFTGGAIGLFGFYLRHKLRETPLFVALEKRHHVAKAPIHHVLRSQKKRILLAFLIGALPLGGFYAIFLFASIYLEQFFHLTVDQGLLLSGGLLLVSTSFLPWVGRCADKTSPKKILLFSALLTAVLTIPLTYAFQFKSFYFVLFFTLLLVLSTSASFALISQAMANLFPTTVRFTSLAMAYNLSNVFFAGVIPMVAIYYMKVYHSIHSLAWSLVFLSLVSAFAVLSLQEKNSDLCA